MAEKILAKNYANIVRKVTEGKPLANHERAIIEAKAARCDDTVTEARSLSELAGILGVSRQSLYNWNKMEDAPKPNANKTLDVIAWRQFMRANGLNAQRSFTDKNEALKARKLLAEVEERELKTSLLKGDYIPLEQVKLEWTTQIGRTRALLESRFLNELPPVLVGKDAVAIRGELEKVLFEAYATLHSGGTCTP